MKQFFKKGNTDLRNGLQCILDSLGYDFGQFSLLDFISWLEGQIGKDFLFLPEDLIPFGVFGAWVTSPNKEIVFIERTLSGHQIKQSVLHEISHLICGHETESVTSNEAEKLIRSGAFVSRNALLRGCSSNSRQEIEAETMASIIQTYEIRNEREKQMSVAHSSHDTKGYLEELGLV